MFQVGNVGGGVSAGEGLGAGELLFCFGLHAEPVVKATEKEGWRLRVGSQAGADGHLRGSLLVEAQLLEHEGELLMGEGIVRGELDGGPERVEGSLGLFLLEEEHAEVEVGLRVAMRKLRRGELCLESDGLAIGGKSVFGMAQALFRETEVVPGLDVAGLEAKAGEKGLFSFFGEVEVVVGAAEQIPSVKVGGIGLGGEGEPAPSVGVVLEEDVVRSDGGELVGGGIAERGGVGKGGEGVSRALLAKEDVAEEEAGFGGSGRSGDDGAKAGFGEREVAGGDEGADVVEGVRGERWNGLGDGARDGEGEQGAGEKAAEAGPEGRWGGMGCGFRGCQGHASFWGVGLRSPAGSWP